MLFIFTTLLSAQIIHGGIKGGVGLTSDLDRSSGSQSQSSVRTKRGMIGPYVEFKPMRFLPALETGFFYRRLRTDNFYGPAPTASLNYVTRTATLIDIPLLLKLRKGSYFASAGSTIRHIGEYNQHWRIVPTFPGFPPVERSQTFSNDDPWRYGISASVGFSKPFKFLSIEPELRYTRWTAQRQIPQQNQIDFLLGVRF